MYEIIRTSITICRHYLEAVSSHSIDITFFSSEQLPVISANVEPRSIPVQPFRIITLRIHSEGIDEYLIGIKCFLNLLKTCSHLRTNGAATCEEEISNNYTVLPF